MRLAIWLSLVFAFALQLNAQTQQDNFGSLFFDGIDDYVEIPDHEDYENLEDLTVELWIKRTDRQRKVALVDYIDSCNTRGTWAFRMYENNLRWIIGKKGLSRGYTSVQKKSDPLVWEHWAFQFSDKADRIQVYLNGQLIHSEYTDASIGEANTVLRLGNDIPGKGSFAFEGWMDDLRIWNRLLSESEIQANIRNAKPQVREGLIGFWNFEQVDEKNRAKDLSGNRNHAIVHGASPSQHVPYDKRRARATVKVQSKTEIEFTGAEVYPNPANTMTQVRIFQPEQVRALRLLDINGQVVLLKETNNQALIDLQLEEIPSGLYFLEVQGINGIQTVELLVQH